MKYYFPLLTTTPLFSGISEQDMSSMLGCLNAQVKNYKKNQIIFLSGERISSVGVILSGNAQIIKEDVMGNRNILMELGTGELFAEAFSCAKVNKIPVTVISITDTEILFIDYKRIITTCSASCIFHSKLIENMLEIIANKNIMLNQKIECLSKRTTREKLLTYLFSEAQKTGSLEFTIPFNRQELADYLCVDRSAMSNELSKMRDEGIIEFNRSFFSIHNSELPHLNE